MQTPYVSVLISDLFCHLLWSLFALSPFLAWQGNCSGYPGSLSLVVLRIKPRGLCMLGNCFNTELFSQPQNETLIISFKSSKLSNLAIPISLSFILVSFPFSLPSCLPLSFFSGEGVEKASCDVACCGSGSCGKWWRRHCKPGSGEPGTPKHLQLIQ